MNYLYLLLLMSLSSLPDWWIVMDQSMEDIDAHAVLNSEKKEVMDDEISIQRNFSFDTFSKTEVILSDSSANSSFQLNYYANKKRVFAYKLIMDVHHYTKGVRSVNEPNRYFEETIIYLRSKSEGLRKKRFFYYPEEISTDSLRVLKNKNQFVFEEIEKKEIQKIVKNYKRLNLK